MSAWQRPHNCWLLLSVSSLGEVPDGGPVALHYI